MQETVQPTKKQRVIVQILFWGAFVVLFAWIIDKNAVPTGRMAVAYTMPQESRQFTKFQSDDDGRLVGKTADSGKNEFLYMTKPPLAFEVYAPRSFTKATVRLTYQNPDSQPVLRLGIKQSGPGFLYRDMVVNDPTLDALPAWWQKVTDGSKTLWERNADYEQKVQQNEEAKALQKKAIEKKFQQDMIILAKSEMKHEISEDIYDERIHALAAQRDQDIVVLDDRYRIPVQEMKEPIFASVDDFMKSKPDPEKTVLYNTKLPPLRLDSYTPSETGSVITTSLRGSHQIVTYIGKGETLSFTLTLQGINRENGKDPFSIIVTDVNRTVLNKRLDPMGNGGATNTPSEELKVTVEKTGLPEGMYTLSMHTNDDILIKHIETPQRYIVFAGNLYIAENAEYEEALGMGPFTGVTAYTDGTMLSALTAHAAGLQTLTVGSAHLTVDQVKKSVQRKLTRPQTTLVAPKNDIKLSGDGYFALSPDQMFALPPQYATYSPGMDLSGYDFILADYPQPQKQGDWLVAQATLTDEVYRNKDHLVRFAIAMPGLAENHRAMKIRSVQIMFEKHPLTPRYLWVKLSEKARKLLRR